ncbi:MAG: H-NS histone family protein [Rhodocyclaceae bacterium]|jgi:DNA-binding protein H-NS|nr:H-NS histone family protein [Rhodocyclaceae bacterium]
MDLSNLNLDQLKDLLKKIPGEIKRRTEEATNAAREAAIEKLKAIAREHGYSLEELAGAKKGRKAGSGSRKPVAPKYANPANRSETWTGRGRKPLWVQAALNQGKSLESLLIR